MDHTKMNPKYLDSPCQDLSVCGLGFVVALTVFTGIDFCVRVLGIQSSCTKPAVKYSSIDSIFYLS